MDYNNNYYIFKFSINNLLYYINMILFLFRKINKNKRKYKIINNKILTNFFYFTAFIFRNQIIKIFLIYCKYNKIK